LRILISNDDGIEAKGISTLAQRLASDSNNFGKVTVCAPDRERSATGHGLTLHKPLRANEVELGERVNAWYTTGTPSDCVKFAVGCLLEKDRPDYILSGINNGANLGTEILYSGTVSAAMEGAFFNIPSIAVSLVLDGHSGGTKHFEVAADFVARLLPQLHQSKLLVGKTLLNINVPNLPADQIKGVMVTRLGVRAYNDYFEKRIDPRGKTYYWLAGEVIEEGEEENTDAWCVAKNMISLTPITFNMTDFAMVDKLKQWGGLATSLDTSNRSAVDAAQFPGKQSGSVSKDAK
jgi:5'-nucleotidase